MITKTDYIKQANDFLKKTDTTMTVQFIKYDFHFDRDKNKKNIYNITFQRVDRKFAFNFGQSINCSGKYWKHGKS